ncbi:MAG: PRC-barrel domain-containing protein [DPANN group archaeon]|nr:PRC-barrel domain-containing protein [DPANN group archaeon]
MIINEMDISKIIGKEVFTDKGAYCGQTSDIELDLARFRVKSIRVDAAKGTYLAAIVGGKKGVKVPYPMVQAISDIIIIKHIKPQVDEEMPQDA